MLKACQLLQDKVDLTLVGPMADAKDLLDNYKGNYHWIPYADHSSLNSILKEVDLFVFPSYLDSWAMVVVEAMACGLPVIVSEHTGSKESVDEGSGYVIAAGDEQALKEKMEYFYNDRSALPRMGENARKSAEKYLWENYYNRIHEVIKEINGKR